MDISAANTSDLAVRRLEKDHQLTPVVHKPNSSFTGEQIVTQGGSEVRPDMWQKKPHKKDKGSKKPENKQFQLDSSEVESNVEPGHNGTDGDDQPHFLDVRV